MKKGMKVSTEGLHVKVSMEAGLHKNKCKLIKFLYDFANFINRFTNFR